MLRRNLDLDLGTMQLDSAGQWIDPGPIGAAYGYPGKQTEQPEEVEPSVTASENLGLQPATFQKLDSDSAAEKETQAAELGLRAFIR